MKSNDEVGICCVVMAPDLTSAAVVDKWSDAELYWIIKNDIEHSGLIALHPTAYRSVRRSSSLRFRRRVSLSVYYTIPPCYLARAVLLGRPWTPYPVPCPLLLICKETPDTPEDAARHGPALARPAARRLRRCACWRHHCPVGRARRCRFHPRCPLADAGCKTVDPQLELKAGRLVACVKV